MNIEKVLAEARRLHQSADKDWPGGFHPQRVMLLAAKCLAVLDAAATSPEKAKELVAQLEEVQLAW